MTEQSVIPEALRVVGSPILDLAYAALDQWTKPELAADIIAAGMHQRCAVAALAYTRIRVEANTRLKLADEPLVVECIQHAAAQFAADLGSYRDHCDARDKDAESKKLHTIARQWN